MSWCSVSYFLPKLLSFCAVGPLGENFSASCAASPRGGIGPPGLLQHILLHTLVSQAARSLPQHTEKCILNHSVTLCCFVPVVFSGMQLRFSHVLLAPLTFSHEQLCCCSQNIWHRHRYCVTSVLQHFASQSEQSEYSGILLIGTTELVGIQCFPQGHADSGCW